MFLNFNYCHNYYLMYIRQSLFLALISIVIFTSCKKNGTPTPTPTPKPVVNPIVDVVYAAGFTIDTHNVSHATIWRNGAATILDNTSGNSFVGTITLSGADVYATGIVYDAQNTAYPTLWKNGIARTVGALPGQFGPVYGVTVLDGSDLYAVGSLQVPQNSFESKSNATYWKNGIATTIDTSYSEAFSITLMGSDVYTAGITVPAFNEANATYWKNGIKTVLNSSPWSYANVIAVNGSDIYVAGVIMDDQNFIHFSLWKNGVLTKESGSSYSVGSSNPLKAIVINGTDVYVAGLIFDQVANHATLWKNGVPTILDINDATTVFGYASAIALNGTDVYVGGQNGAGAAVYWKNVVPVQLNSMGGVNSMVLVTH